MESPAQFNLSYAAANCRPPLSPHFRVETAPILIATQERTEFAVTYSKQTVGAISNRNKKPGDFKRFWAPDPPL